MHFLMISVRLNDKDSANALNCEFHLDLYVNKGLRSYISHRLGVGLVDAALQREVERAAGDHQSLPQLLIERLDRSRIYPGTPQNLQHKACVSHTPK